jgi:regulator of RNase E activity RraA
MGELSAETLQFRGVRGYVTDGASRDCGFIKRIGFPVFCRDKTPRDVVGAWTPDAFNEPIALGGCGIAAGDYVIGDIDGVVVIPSAIVASVIDEVETVMQTENLVRKAILEGVDPKEAYLRYGKF